MYAEYPLSARHCAKCWGPNSAREMEGIIWETDYMVRTNQLTDVAVQCGRSGGPAQGCSRKDQRGASEGELPKEGGASSSGRKVALS